MEWWSTEKGRSTLTRVYYIISSLGINFRHIMHLVISNLVSILAEVLPRYSEFSCGSRHSEQIPVEGNALIYFNSSRVISQVYTLHNVMYSLIDSIVCCIGFTSFSLLLVWTLVSWRAWERVSLRGRPAPQRIRKEWVEHLLVPSDQDLWLNPGLALVLLSAHHSRCRIAVKGCLIDTSVMLYDCDCFRVLVLEVWIHLREKRGEMKREVD